MTGIDTNILVRFYIEDDPEQYQKVHRLFNRCSVDDPIFINHVVLVEWFWVLNEVYDVPKNDLVEEIEYLLKSKDTRLQIPSDIEQALKDYKINNLDFADCLIGTLNSRRNCNTTYTFDKAASKLAPFTLLE